MNQNRKHQKAPYESDEDSSLRSAAQIADLGFAGRKAIQMISFRVVGKEIKT